MIEISEDTWGLLYMLVALVIALIGTMLFREEIKQPHTDTGSGVILVSVLWGPGLIFLVCIILPMMFVEWLALKAIDINLGGPL